LFTNAVNQVHVSMTQTSDSIQLLTSQGDGPNSPGAPMVEVANRLGHRVRELRRQLSSTQEELAHRARISVSFLSMVERGERLPRLETLADALGASFSELFTGINEPRNANAQILRPLIAFLEGQPLNADDLERLLVVAKALFKTK
jgi:transcriptional regulator with XRE-family HTH domain